MPDYIVYLTGAASRGRDYGLSNLVGDATLTLGTFGLWAIWWIVREIDGNRVRGYGLSNLIGDLLLTCFTFGLWAVWWLIREIKR